MRPEIDPNAQKASIGHMLRSIITNRALVSIIAAAILMLLSQLTLTGMANYVFPNYYSAPDVQSLSSLLTMALTFVIAAVAKPIAVKIGKREMSIIASFISVIGLVAAFIVRPQNVWVFVVFYMFAYLGIAMFSMFCWALITDVIDYSELKNGVREDGTVYAVYSFARKLGQAASSGLTGALLSLVGYTAATAYEPDVLEGVFNISTIVPAVGFLLLGLVLLLWYPLDKKTVDANVIALKKKHGEL